MAEELTGAQRRHLRGLAHALEPVIQIGHKGLAAPLVQELSRALECHELCKVRLGRHAPLAPTEAARELAKRTGAEVAQVIGRVVLLYREATDPEARKIEIPGREHPPPAEPAPAPRARGRRRPGATSRPRPRGRTNPRSGRRGSR